MTFRLALRSLVAQPVRSAILAGGFGLGIAVMAALLGVGEVILDQARAPELKGGGDLVVYGTGGRLPHARFVLSRLLGAPDLAERVAAVSPRAAAELYLVDRDEVVPVAARGGIPSLERAIDDAETAAIDAWVDAPGDAAWTEIDDGELLRSIDRFHPIPEAPEWQGSWAEWLYFNGQAGEVKLYLSFLFGPEEEPGLRRAFVRLQLDQRGSVRTFWDTALVGSDELVARAPDVDVGGSRVRLEGEQYRIHLELHAGPADDNAPPSGAPDLTGDLVLDATGGRSAPPFVVRGARDWVSGYVVPVFSGVLNGELRVGGEALRVEGGRGYHDHNWGFWRDVTWQWGQVAHQELAIVYGRIRPPAEAVDAERLPGFLGLLGPEGPLAFSTSARIEETDGPDGSPREVRLTAAASDLDLEARLTVDSVIRTPGNPRVEGQEAVDFLQMRATYRVTGEAGGQSVDFTAAGSAETFRSARRRRSGADALVD